jgi:K+-transporting ATPase KdpF subunit
MSAENIIRLVVGIALAVYLFLALTHPKKF